MPRLWFVSVERLSRKSSLAPKISGPVKPVSAMPIVAKLIQLPQTLLPFNVAATEMAMIERNKRFHAAWNPRPCNIDEPNDRPSTYTEYAARSCKQAQII